MITLDTSAWMNAISAAEPGHADSSQLFDHLVASRTTIIVPTLLQIEMAATLSRSGRLAASVRETIERFAAFDFVRWIPLDERIAKISCDIAIEHHLRGADAVFAAVAMDNRCKLISLDHEHLTRIATILTVVTPVQALADFLRKSP